MAHGPLHPFRPRLLSSLRGYDRSRFLADVGAGFTVGVVALPLALAFGIASGATPAQGLATAIIGGLLISLLGGSSVQIGGPAGAFVVVVYAIIERHGLGGLLASTVMAGLLMFALGLLRLGALVRYIPVGIVIGFTNGIAVLIAFSQLRDLLGLPIAKLPGEFFAQLSTVAQHLDRINPWALALGMACTAGLLLWQRLWAQWLPRPWLAGGPGWWLSRLPGPLVALVTLTAAAAAWQLPVETIQSRFGGLPSGLPGFSLPPLSWDSARQLLMPTLTIALLGAIESLLCARAADAAGAQPRHDPNQELMAQGVANVVTPFFGGIPATGTIARTMTNLRAGATSPIAGIVHALTLLLILLVAAPLAGAVPLAVLAGILLFTAWNMFEGHEFRRLRHFHPTYRALMLGTFVLTVLFDLTVAIEFGLVLACVFFIWRTGSLFSARPAERSDTPAGVAVVRLQGSLFFGAVGKVEALGDSVPSGVHTLVLDLERLVMLDSSGVDALAQLQRTLWRQQVGLLLAGAKEQPAELLARSGLRSQLGEGAWLADADAATLAARFGGTPTAGAGDAPPDTGPAALRPPASAPAAPTARH